MSQHYALSSYALTCALLILMMIVIIIIIITVVIIVILVILENTSNSNNSNSSNYSITGVSFLPREIAIQDVVIYTGICTAM